MANTKRVSNIVNETKLREVQLAALEHMSDAVMKTAGPYGSNTLILNANAAPIYSKDGKRILENIRYFGIIENAIADQIQQLTCQVVKEVGDGTTTATRMSYLIFKALYEYELKYPKYQLIKAFKDAVAFIQNRIKANAKEITLDDIYDICMISTNGHEELSTAIAEIYKKHGFDVDITLNTSNTKDYQTKEYDGVVLEKGYASPAYITDKDNAACKIKNPHLYFFEDPVNTVELRSLFEKIIFDNVIRHDPHQNPNPSVGIMADGEYVPTVIFMPNTSRDVDSLLEQLETMMYQYGNAKPPICIVTQLNRYMDDVYDIARICGAKMIKKYIDPEQQKIDIESGLAPTIENVTEFCGYCEEFTCTSEKSTFTNPEKMFKRSSITGGLIYGEDGNPVYDDMYHTMITYIEGELNKAISEGADITTIGNLKRRLRKFKQEMVEFYVGGISSTDRTAFKDLAEDAILNCKSAAANGVGRGASFEGLIASTMATAEQIKDLSPLAVEMLSIISEAYQNMIVDLYKTCMAEDEAKAKVSESIGMDIPLNLRSMEFDGKVKTSINTDICILDAISRIVTIIFTANQAALPSPGENTYLTNEDL